MGKGSKQLLRVKHRIHLANHGKPWDGKAMGTKVSNLAPAKLDAMLARLLDRTLW